MVHDLILVSYQMTFWEILETLRNLETNLELLPPPHPLFPIKIFFLKT